MTKSPPRPVIVSLTAIPPRFSNLASKVESLLRQSVPAEAIEIYIPNSYRRFPNAEAVIPALPKGVQIVRVEEDLGPATKLLPALERWHGHDVDILICDDDRLQDRDWIKRFVDTRLERPHDIICERGWNIADRFEFSQAQRLEPRARFSPRQGRTFSYRLKRALSLGAFHPKRSVFEISGYVDVFEGFLGALVPAGSLPRQAWTIPDILWTVDDVWLSGMARLQGVGVWAHSYPRPVYSNGHWDKVEALTDWVEQGTDRQNADLMCIKYMRTQHKVWQ